MRTAFTTLFLMLFVSASLLGQWKEDPAIVFTDYVGNPIFNAYGPPGSWNGATKSGVRNLGFGNLFDDGRRYYATGFDGNNFAIGFYSTGCYTDSLVEYDNNPVFQHGLSGAWDDKHVCNGLVIADSGKYKLYYTGSKTDEILQIGVATSNDGITWTRHPNNPVLTKGASGEWDDKRVFMPYVLKTDTTYLMYYSGDKGAITGASIGLATSTNGVDWTRYEGNPILESGTGWEARSNLQAIIMELEDHLGLPKFLMAYSGYDLNNFNIGLARSEDGYSWEKYEGNPVIQCVDSLAWKSKYLLPIDMFITKSGDSLAICYGTEGDDESRSGAIAYAAIDPIKTWVNIEDEDNRPDNFSLKQNYPNPFNPSTTINYQLTVISDISIIIYNSLGQKVRSLFSGRQQMGFHELSWDGKDDLGRLASSGIYFYNLKTDGKSETKKMILLR